jgi:hypothetical protein
LLLGATVDFSPMLWLPLFLGAYDLVSSGRQSAREVAVMVFAIFAAGCFLDGGDFLVEANDRWEQGRELNPALSLALALLTLAAVLGLAAAYLWGLLRWPTPKYVTVPGVVTSVQSIEAGGTMHWRVRFAYFSVSGTAYESVDEIYVAGLEPNDDCTVVYPPEQPDLGTLRSFSTASASSNAPPAHAFDRAMDRAAG